VGNRIDVHAEAVFRESLRELGRVEGKNLVIEWRYAGGSFSRCAELIKELVRLNLDCLITVGVDGTRSAMQATRTIPVVMADADDDPVRQGLIARLARPGGNVTGVTSISSELAGKRLELLREIFPALARVAILAVPESDAAAGHARETDTAARAMGLELQSMEVSARFCFSNRAQTRSWSSWLAA
jgi:putative ABC transport system substrate-binding protein